ncbi:MAG: L-ribulose-5-phosphate 4-epimerase [Ruminiclostridium sp.]|nr:L-ribulose-5-phosphate 4-epimerase [Ruminiclostridium sp.]
MLEELKERVCKANIRLRDSGLVILTWGNVSAIDRKSGLIVIKPSGVSYDELTPDKMVVVNMDGKVVEGNFRPSSDTPTHIALYQAFEELGGVVHTHSRYATVWAQAGLDIVAYGTTHADYFYGDIPCTMPLEENMITEEYERNTGYAIVDTFARRNLGCMEVPACLVAQHGPFAWGETPEKAVENAIVLEEIAHMAVFNTNFQFGLTRISEALMDKHYFRKHGENAYYGQPLGGVAEINPNEIITNVPVEDIQIAPSNHTVELKNISQIGEVERPIINKPPKKEEKVFNFDDKPAEDNGGDISEEDIDITAPVDEPFELTPSEPEVVGGAPIMPTSPVQAVTSEQSSIPSEPVQPVQPDKPAGTLAEAIQSVTAPAAPQPAPAAPQPAPAAPVEQQPEPEPAKRSLFPHIIHSKPKPIRSLNNKDDNNNNNNNTPPLNFTF